MEKKDILLVMTICALLEKPTNPAAVQIQYQHAQRLLAEQEKRAKQ